MSAALEAKKRKDHIAHMEAQWRKIRNPVKSDEMKLLEIKQKVAEANWRKIRKQTGLTGTQSTL